MPSVLAARPLACHGGRVTEPDDELVRLRGQLAEEQQRNKQLEKRSWS